METSFNKECTLKKNLYCHWVCVSACVCVYTYIHIHIDIKGKARQDCFFPKVHFVCSFFFSKLETRSWYVAQARVQWLFTGAVTVHYSLDLLAPSHPPTSEKKDGERMSDIDTI